MHPRRWLLPGVLLTLFAAAVILPSTDPGREWLLERATAVVEDLGYELSYASSSGNPWFGVDLLEVELSGPGVKLSADSLSVDYFLPSLLTGDLPLSVVLAGVRGDLDPASLAVLGGGSGKALVSPRLRELAIRDVAISVDGSPWTLPGLDLEDVVVEQSPEGLDFTVTISTNEGNAKLAGTLTTPWRLELEIVEADARLARHWWEGAQAGRLQGRLVADEDGIVARGHLSGGAVEYLGSRVESISGPVSYEGGVVEAALAGRALGGPVTAEVEVNVPARYWEGSLQGTPELAALAAWLAKDDFSTDALAITGTARVELEASGWSAVSLSGRGSGGGAILDLPLEELQANFGYSSMSGTSVQASAALGGGPLVMTLRPQGGSSRLQLAARGVSLAHDLEAEWNVAAALTPAGTSGTLEAAVEGKYAGRGLNLAADGVLNEDGLQLFVSGSDQFGATGEGAAVIAGAAVEGQVSVAGLTLPGLDGPVDLALSGLGTLANLPLELRLTGVGSEQLSAFGMTVEDDFSGLISGVLAEGRVRDLKGELGPFSFNGDLDLSPFALRGDFRLATVTTGGALDSRFASNGSLSLEGSEFEADGELHLERVASEAVELGALDLDLQVAWSKAEQLLLSLASRQVAEEGEPRLRARVTGESATLELAQPPVSLGGRPVSLEGTVLLPFTGMPRADLTARADGLLLRIRPAPGGQLWQVNARPGLELGSVTLREPLEASGRIDAAFERGEAQGRVAGAPFSAEYRREGSRSIIDASLGGSGSDFRLSFGGPAGSWSYGGTLDMGPLARAVGVPLEGQVSGELQKAQGYSGRLDALADLAGVGIDLSVTGAGQRLTLAGNATALEVPWQLQGEATAAAGQPLPGELTLTAASQYGELQLHGTAVSGSGELPPEIGPATTSGAPWNLTGDLEQARLLLGTASSEAVLDWSGGVTLEAQVEEEFALAGLPARLDAGLAWSAGQPGAVEGSLSLAGQDLLLTGDLEQISLQGELDAGSLSRELLGTPLLAGVLGVEAALPLADPTAATANLTLQAGDSSLTARADSSGGELQLTVSGPGLEANYRPGAFSMVAQEANLAPYLAEAVTEFNREPGTTAGLVADGSLAHGPQQGWQGTMELRGDLPLPGTPLSTVRLSGQGGSLLAQAEVSAPNYQAEAAGTLFPALDLTLEANALGNQAELSGRATGSLSDPAFRGVLTSQQLVLGPLALPALSLEAEYTSGSGLTVASDALGLSLDGEALAGSLDIGLALSGQPHQLEGTITGTVEQPLVELAISGPIAAGTATWQGQSGSAAIDFDPTRWLSGPLTSRAPAHLDLTLARSLDWSAAVTAPLTLAGEPWQLQGTVAGRGSEYDGVATLAHTQLPEAEADLIAAGLRGTGSEWSVNADLARTDARALATLLPVASDLRAAGELHFSSDLNLTVDGGLTGALAGQSLDLNLSGDSGAGITVSGTVAAATVEATATRERLAYSVNTSDLRLEGQFGWMDEFRLSLDGLVAGAEVRASGRFDPADRTGTVEAWLAGARLKAEARPAGGAGAGAAADGAVRVTADLTGPLSEARPYGAEASILIKGNSVVVENLDISGAVAEPWQVELAGPLWPSPALAGTFTAPLDALSTSLAGELELNGRSLTQPQLLISSSGVKLAVQRQDGLWNAGLTGQGELAGAHLDAGLAWSESAGFEGSLELQLPMTDLVEALPASRLDLTLAGEGGLHAGLALHTPGAGEPLASGDLRLSARPWNDQAVAGELRFAGDLEELWPGYPGQPVGLSGQVAVTGTIPSPVLSGPLALAGALEGSGQVQWQGGQGSLELTGDRFNVSANAGMDGGFDAVIAATSLDLEPLWPVAQGVTADFRANLSRSPGSPLRGEVSTFHASSGASSVDGSAALAETVEARLNLDIHLEDFPTQPLVGSLEGGLTLQAANLDQLAGGRLRGALQLANAGLADSATRLSGEVSVAGAANDPILELALLAAGGARGEMLIAARPAQEQLRVSSDLTWGELTSRFRVEATPATVAAAGRVELPNGGFAVSSPAGSRQILLDGDGTFRGWQARLDADTLGVELTADLSTLGADTSGTIDIRIGGEPDPWLRGRATRLAWGGIVLGDLSFSSDAPGEDALIDGPNLSASVNPFAGPSWQVERLALDLPNGLRLDASGSGAGRGSGSALSAQLRLSGEVAGAPARLPLQLLKRENEPLTIEGSGDLLRGGLTVDALLAEAWQGSITATGLELAGSSTDLTGDLSGDPLAPRLALEASSAGRYATITATSVLSTTELSLEALVVSPYLSEPLSIEAHSAEGGSVTIESAASAITVSAGAQAASVNGAVEIDAGYLHLALSESDDQATSLEALLTIPQLPGFALATSIGTPQLAAPASLLAAPLTFRGRSATSGEVQLTLTPPVATVTDLRYRGEAVDLGLTGTLGPGGRAELAGVLSLEGTSGGLLPTLPVGSELPFELTLADGAVALRSSGELGTASLDLDLGAGGGSLETDLRLGGGTLSGRVEFDSESGPSGSLRARALPLVVLADQEPLRLTGDFEVTPESVGVFAQLQAAGGSLRANGTIGLGLLLPEELAPHGGLARRLELQLGTFDLSSVPWVARHLPYLSAPLSGFLQIVGSRVVGRLVAPDLTVAGDALPLSMDISGTEEQATLSGVVAGSPIQVTVDGESMSALAHLERFPLHLLAQAATGPLDVSAEVTGVGRFDLPWAGDAGPLVELATELVRLERAGVVTTGNVSLAYAGGELLVNEAHFSGAGTWQASGAVRRDLLDLSLSATDADFGPLLGLVPLFARYEVGASGSLELVTSGTLADPVVTLTTPGLDFEIAGSSYHLSSGEASLQDEQLRVAAAVEGVDPFSGRLDITGNGQLDLLPPGLGDARFEAVGSANVPGLGAVEEFRATLTSKPNEPLRITGGGRLGAPFTLAGTLLPLDLTLTGDDLAIRLPYLLLASAQVDARLRMQWLESLRFSGRLGVDQALFELGIRPPRDSQENGPNPVAQQVVFDQVVIEAPGRVRFMENFGSAETSLALTLGGSAAQPTLSGSAQVLRGTIRFSGRDFEITSAEARFDPSRGVLPIVDVAAVTRFDTDQVLPQDRSVRFVEPEAGGRFEVVLSFTGELESTPGTSPPFRLDLSPALTSQALIQEVRADGTTSAPRPLSEPELLSLITLGRLDLEAPIASEAGLAAAVAEGAIDTAVDFLLVSELQNALAEALGVDVVEINTTAFSSIFGRSQSEPFSVSLRLGGYLSDEVFASYRIGTFDDVQGLYALTNEVNLIYELGPVEIDLAGRVNFEDGDVPTPDAEVSATVRYDFSPLTAIEGGIDLSDERQQVRFGVTLRW